MYRSIEWLFYDLQQSNIVLLISQRMIKDNEDDSELNEANNQYSIDVKESDLDIDECIMN